MTNRLSHGLIGLNIARQTRIRLLKCYLALLEPPRMFQSLRSPLHPAPFERLPDLLLPLLLLPLLLRERFDPLPRRPRFPAFRDLDDE